MKNRRNINESQIKASNPTQKIYDSDFSTGNKVRQQDSARMQSDHSGMRNSSNYEEHKERKMFKDRTKQVVNNENDFSSSYNKNINKSKRETD